MSLALYIYVCVCVCVCVCVYLHVSLVNNSFMSVVVPVKHSCTGRRPSQVITALTGHSRHSPATPQMCVFRRRQRRKHSRGNYSGDRDAHREKSFVTLLHNSSKQVDTDMRRKSQIQIS